MRPVDAEFKVHDPEQGWYGDCHRACIASLLEMDLCQVPHFYGPEYPETADALRAQDEFLSQFGLCLVDIPVQAPNLDSFLRYVSTYSGPTYWLMCGQSVKGHAHSVICHRDSIVHDPTYGDPHGIVGAHHGFFWAGWLARR